ncbi:periplasmic substrate-binding domain-containing protein [Flindersiella endophytica]
MRHSTSRKVFALAAGVALVMAAAACGGDEGDGGSSNTQKQVPLIFGTTENFVGADPAASYDWPSSLLLTNTSQTLLEIPAGGNKPSPDVAESCKFDDPKTYTCKLKKGLKFSDGSALDSADVKFSMDRMIGIADDQGPSSIYEPSLASTEAPDPLTVTYKLKYPDATWPMRLTYGGAAIVPSDKYSATAIQKDGKKFVGSGPYKIVKFDPSQQIVLEENTNYTGSNKPIHKQVIIQKFKDEASLKAAVENNEVQVAFRTLSPTLISDLEKNGAKKGVKVLKGDGVGISYVVFNLLNGPFKQKEVRQAFAYMIDRKSIATDIYDGTVDPLYTMVPSAFAGSTETFKTKYGEAPNPAEAKKLLQQAGVTMPVKAQLWWNPDHYGQTSADMYAEIERQVEKDGVFDISLQNAAWDRYKVDYPKGVYPAFQLGWYPDFPDADNYLSPFYQTGNFMEKGSGYSSKPMDKLLTDERSNAEPSKREPSIVQAQTLGAEDVPTLPIWQDKMIAATRDGVTGVEKTFDAANQIRFWLIDATKAK